MGIETKTKKIGEHTYSTMQWGARTSAKHLARLGRLGLPSAARALGAFTGGDVGSLDADIDGDMLGAAADKLMEQADDDTVDWIFDKILAGVQCDGVDLVPDAHFAGDMLLLGNVVLFVLEANYKSFFGKLRSVAASAKAKAAAKRKAASGAKDSPEAPTTPEPKSG